MLKPSLSRRAAFTAITLGTLSSLSPSPEEGDTHRVAYPAQALSGASQPLVFTDDGVPVTSPVDRSLLAPQSAVQTIHTRSDRLRAALNLPPEYKMTRNLRGQIALAFNVSPRSVHDPELWFHRFAGAPPWLLYGGQLFLHAALAPQNCDVYVAKIDEVLASDDQAERRLCRDVKITGWHALDDRGTEGLWPGDYRSGQREFLVTADLKLSSDVVAIEARRLRGGDCLEVRVAGLDRTVRVQLPFRDWDHRTIRSQIGEALSVEPVWDGEKRYQKKISRHDRLALLELRKLLREDARLSRVKKLIRENRTVEEYDRLDLRVVAAEAAPSGPYIPTRYSSSQR